MPEAVRLVIWDLDETFWQGALSEGGVTKYVQEHHALVIELARRGIMSSICSKNDYETVKSLLTEKGLWDYFVFPSISWEPKGPRIAALVDNAQLRPPTILFIDDNPSNRAEAAAAAPGIQVADERIIPQMLASPLFKGASDPELTRLARYKLLERRSSDQAEAADAAEFLRSSGIRVRFEYDVAKHIERAIELINRTNQLNYTKSRLPEDDATARLQLNSMLASHEIKAALVGVSDRYGDHGWCGVYVLHNDGTLLQYAFSCRILGMGVETWLFDKLGRPHLRVVGEVLADVKDRSRTVDWIKIDQEADAADARDCLIERVVARGGCDLMPVAHYFGALARSVVGEFNTHRFGLDGRIDHSSLLRKAASGGLGPDEVGPVQRLGYMPADFESALFSEPTDSDVWLLSFWTDAAYALYRHRTHDLAVPYALPGYHAKDARAADAAEFDEGANTGTIAQALRTLRDEFVFEGLTSEEEYKSTLTHTFEKAPSSAKIFVLLANEYFVDEDSVAGVMEHTARLNRWTEAAAARFRNVFLLNIRDFVQSESEVHSRFHFDRMVYYRLFKCAEHIVRCATFPADYRDWRLHRLASLDEMIANCRNADEMSRTALLLARDGRVEEAVALARRAVQSDPGSAVHHNAYLQVALSSDEPACREYVRTAARRADLSAVMLHKLGVAHFDRREFALARSCFERAAELEPSVLHHRHGVANCLARLGDKAAACAILLSCMDAGDDNVHVMAHLGRLLTDLERYEEAESLLQRLSEIDPGFQPGKEAAAHLAAKRAHPIGAAEIEN